MILAGVSRDYLRIEARRAPCRAALATAIGGILVVLGSHALIVRLPSPVLHFMEQAFRIEGMASILLINDLLVAYFVGFFLGLGSIIDATVAAREEGALEIILAKPVPGSVLLAARVGPVLATSAATAFVVAVAIAIALSRHRGAGDPITGGGALGSSLFLVALWVTLLSALLPVLVITRDRLQAMLLAAMTWITPLLPTGFFIYRPDLFVSEHGVTSRLLLPSLLWHDATAAWLGPVALAASIPFSVLMMMFAGWLLERSDAR